MLWRAVDSDANAVLMARKVASTKDVAFAFSHKTGSNKASGKYLGIEVVPKDDCGHACGFAFWTVGDDALNVKDLLMIARRGLTRTCQ